MNLTVYLDSERFIFFAKNFHFITKYGHNMLSKNIIKLIRFNFLVFSGIQRQMLTCFQVGQSMYFNSYNVRILMFPGAMLGVQEFFTK